MNLRDTCLLSTLLLLIALATSSQSQQIFDFTPPKPVEAQNPKYPRIAAEQNKEGYTIFNFMIGTDGVPFDPVVLYSTDPVFEAPSLEAIQQLKYEPALLDGKPVEASHHYKFTFQMKNAASPRDHFMRTERFFRDAMSEGDLDKAAEYHAKLMAISADNIYERGIANFAGYYLAREKKDTRAQYGFLTAAMAFHKNEGASRPFLPKESEPLARAELFRIQTELKLYAEAAATFRLMRRSGDEAVATLRPFYQEIHKLATSESGYQLEGELSSGGIRSIGLLKPSFYVNTAKGKLVELKLHCTAKHKVFAYIEDSQYEVPDSWGRCELILVGDPGSEFALVQFGSAS